MPRILLDNMNLECTLRLLAAVLCGGIIGIERSKRNKGAGARTHIIVAVGACLFVIVSKYGFSDLQYGEGMQVDIARIASNIVTGVSFLGAGIIFTKGNTVQGLTTSAGIWFTAAAGLAVGTGMYITGIACSVMVLVVQVVFHRDLFSNYSEKGEVTKIVVQMADDPKEYEKLKRKLARKNVLIKGSHIKKHKDGTLSYTFSALMPKDLSPSDILSILNECPNITSLGM